MHWKSCPCPFGFMQQYWHMNHCMKFYNCCKRFCFKGKVWKTLLYVANWMFNVYVNSSVKGFVDVFVVLSLSCIAPSALLAVSVLWYQWGRYLGEMDGSFSSPPSLLLLIISRMIACQFLHLLWFLSLKFEWDLHRSKNASVLTPALLCC